jgi:AraC-like DNA-binding protein
MDANRLLARPWLPGVELFHADFSGQAFGRHSHDAFAIGAILQGVGGYQCRGARHALPAGTLSLMNPEEPHTGHAETPRLVYRMLYVEESRLPVLLGRKALPRGFRELNPVDDGAVAAGLLRLAGEFERDDALALESELLALLELVFVRHGGLSATAEARRDGEVTARLRDYLEAHYAEPVALEQLAALVQRHPRHLIEAFRRAYGVPPHTYLLQRRVREAKRLLLAGEPPLEVALALGFYDQAHFSGTFKRFTGVAPGRFQRLARTGVRGNRDT